MTAVRIHHYTVDPADFDELLARRATLIAAMRAAHPGLTETRLTRLQDGTYTDTWRWASPEQMQTAFADTKSFPEAGAAMSLTSENSAQSGEIVDER